MFESILLGKTVSRISKLKNRPGSTWPGHLALKVDSQFVKKILRNNPNLDIILIAGTNGKTTTTKLIEETLTLQGKKIFRNEAGANLLNGIASTLVTKAKFNGKIEFDTGIFEVDENSLPLVIAQLSMINNKLSIVLLNLFRDQLDRYGEVNTVAKKWLASLKTLDPETILVVNGDDPMLRYIGENSNLHAFYFGISSKHMEKKGAPHDVDFLYCPNCQEKLSYAKRSYSHMGLYKCPKCGFKHRETAVFEELPNPMFGIYNKYNINAATLLLQKAYGLDPKNMNDALLKFNPAFGRQEKILYNGHEIFLLLSKNPTGFNQSIHAILEQEKNPNLLLLLNDRVPDGRDVSWIWDVEFEELDKAKHIVISGDRAFDMALRIKYANISNFTPTESLSEAIKLSLAKLNDNETLYILATYSAMLETRKILKGRSIL